LLSRLFKSSNIDGKAGYQGKAEFKSTGESGHISKVAPPSSQSHHPFFKLSKEDQAAIDAIHENDRIEATKAVKTVTTSRKPLGEPRNKPMIAQNQAALKTNLLASLKDKKKATEENGKAAHRIQHNESTRKETPEVVTARLEAKAEQEDSMEKHDERHNERHQEGSRGKGLFRGILGKQTKRKEPRK
jgi:hypothetical protein